MNILTLSDGFGDSEACPAWYPKYFKWPDLVRLMTKHTQVINHSRYGAGNEFIVNQLKQHIDQIDVALIQWTWPARLDLILAHDDTDFWSQAIQQDVIYKDNVVNCGHDRFWLSSASQVPAVQEYHRSYISLRQHQTRSQIYIEYAKLLLEKMDKSYRFMLTEDSDYLSVDANWLWHQPTRGMSSFRSHSKYRDLDLGLVQPIPLIAFDYIQKIIMPSIDLNWRTDREIAAVESMLYRHYQESSKNQNHDTD